MYLPPKAELIFPESDEIMNLDLLLASEGKDETDNETGIDDLLNGLI